MTSILFVDHDFHTKTGSSKFFVELLGRRFSLYEYTLWTGRKLDYDIISAADEVDIVVIWQLEFLAPLFLAMGKPTVVVPMYDTSRDLPDLHWIASKRARFLNFSLSLHNKIEVL